MSCNTSTVSNFSFYTLQSELETDPGHGETNPDTSISRNMSKDSKRKAPQFKINTFIDGIQSIYIYWENLTEKIIKVIILVSQQNY